LRPEDLSAVHDALERVGADKVEVSAVDAAKSLQDAREVIRRGTTLLAPLRRHGLSWALLLILVAAVAPVVSLLLEHADISGATRVLASLGALLGAVAGVLSAGTRWASNSLSRIDTAEARVRDRVDAAKTAHARKIASVRQKIDQLGRDLSADRQKFCAGQAASGAAAWWAARRASQVLSFSRVKFHAKGSAISL
jgi:hypothetical protein